MRLRLVFIMWKETHSVVVPVFYKTCQLQNFHKLRCFLPPNCIQFCHQIELIALYIGQNQLGTGDVGPVFVCYVLAIDHAKLYLLPSVL